jgi:hypothetical protein
MTFHDKNLDALNEITEKFKASEYQRKMPTFFDATRQHGNFRDAHLEARAKMVGVWPEQRTRK